MLMSSIPRKVTLIGYEREYKNLTISMEIFFQDRFSWPTTTRAYVHVAGGHVEQRGANGRVPVPVEATRDPHLRHPGPRQREGRPRGQREGEDFNVER